MGVRGFSDTDPQPQVRQLTVRGIVSEIGCDLNTLYSVLLYGEIRENCLIRNCPILFRILVHIPYRAKFYCLSTLYSVSNVKDLLICPYSYFSKEFSLNVNHCAGEKEAVTSVILYFCFYA